MKYTEFKGMEKKALLELVPIGFKAMFQAGTGSAILLIAGLSGIGASVGWGAAKMNAKDKQDIGTIQKEYENERLKADLGYVSSKMKSEYDAFKRKQPPKAARVIA